MHFGSSIKSCRMGLGPKRDGSEAVEKTLFSHASVGQQSFFPLGILSRTICIRVTLPKPFFNWGYERGPWALHTAFSSIRKIVPLLSDKTRD